ncbi:hypothetical protein EOD39_6395 [Acipenser ruthenus]|uniref:Uncharacterized protein n=1 Tax=Acipenser ruthenus TaxID=7906 RepID=A0A444UA92_ACIRT|nr:hypothetical protein EOD39_6395 [Acipenser ruthenus]
MKQKTADISRAKLSALEVGGCVLLANKQERACLKLVDLWEKQPYIVVANKADVSVYTVQREHGGSERTVHWNLLAQCKLLPLDHQDPEFPVDQTNSGESK